MVDYEIKEKVKKSNNKSRKANQTKINKIVNEKGIGG
jgi:hypothetical protein